MLFLTENCKKGLEAMTSGAAGDTSWPKLTKEESGSSELGVDAVSVTFSSSGFAFCCKILLLFNTTQSLFFHYQ